MTKMNYIADPSPTFSQLPNEILREILSYVPTTHLLRTCRFVNKTWKEFSTTLCYQRRVKLSARKFEIDALSRLGQFRKISPIFFSNPTALPWSACTISALNDRGGEAWNFHSRPTISEYVSVFLDYFGTQIRELTLEANNYLPFKENLKKIPNVEKLTICCQDAFGIPVSKFMNGSEFQLPRLKEFGIQTPLKKDGNALEFIEIIQRNSPRLEMLNLCLGPNLGTDEMERIVPIIRSVRYICLEVTHTTFFMDSWNVLLDANINNVKELKIKFVYPRRSIPQYYLPLEQFLILNSAQLEKLIICNSNDLNHQPSVFWHGPPLELPQLPRLKDLQFGNCRKLNIRHPSRYRPLDYPFLSLVPFTSSHFPVLRKVNIGSHVSTNGIFANSHFDSVETLWIEQKNYDLTETEWHRVFPNLKELSAWVDAPSLHYIFRNLPNCEKLCLSLNIDTNKHQTTVNSILSGIVRPGKYYREKYYYKETIRKLRETAEHPSLLNMTRLKHLELDFYPSRTKLEDPGAYLSLLEIQPLDYLLLVRANISDVCAQRLSVYHHAFFICSARRVIDKVNRH